MVQSVSQKDLNSFFPFLGHFAFPSPVDVPGERVFSLINTSYNNCSTGGHRGLVIKYTMKLCPTPHNTKLYSSF